jgi:hypothetical protein
MQGEPFASQISLNTLDFLDLLLRSLASHPQEKVENTGTHLRQKCRRCGEAKNAEEFPANRHSRDGLSPWCSDCHNDAVRQHRSRRAAAERKAAFEDLEARNAELRRYAAAWRWRLGPKRRRSSEAGRRARRLRHVAADTQRVAIQRAVTNDTGTRKQNANARLRQAVSHVPADASVPFVCECDDADCLGRVDLTLGEYDERRVEEGGVRLPEHTDTASGHSQRGRDGA